MEMYVYVYADAANRARVAIKTGNGGKRASASRTIGEYAARDTRTLTAVAMGEAQEATDVGPGCARHLSEEAQLLSTHFAKVPTGLVSAFFW